MNLDQLHALFLKHPSICTDTRKLKKDQLFFALRGENFNGNTFAAKALEEGASYAIVDDETIVNGDRYILVDDVLKTLQDLAKMHRRYLNIPIIGLTGSNGKTTTKELIYSVISRKYNAYSTQGNLNNHIGVPLTLLNMNKTHEIGIVEMGANHVGEIAFLANIAEPTHGYITNFGKAHLEGFGSIEGVIKGKSELYDFLKASDGIIFVNGSDIIQQKLLKDPVHTVAFNLDDADGPTISCKNSTENVVVEVDGAEIESNLTGAYNYNNIAAAICIGHYFGVGIEDIKKGISSYIPENNRSQQISKGTNQIILDAYNANPSSMQVALENLAKHPGETKVAILGDMFELGEYAQEEHTSMALLAIELNIDFIFLIGNNFFGINTEAETLHKFKTLDDFAEHLQTHPIENSTILIKGSRGMALEKVLEVL